MSFSPGVNAVAEPMLFGAPTCTVCGKEMEPGGKGKGGRPRKYCSKACSSRSDRQREKERQEQALAAASESPRGETRLPDEVVSSPEAVELLELGDELRRQDRVFLLRLDRAARSGDAALARQALDDVLHAAHALTARHRELAERILAAYPTRQGTPADAAPAATVSPRGETRPVPAAPRGAAGTGPAVVSAGRAATPGTESLATPPRGETLMPADQAPSGRQDRLDGAEAPRGETSLTATNLSVPPVAPRGETSPTAQAGERALRELVDRRLAQQTAATPLPAAPTGPEPMEVTVPADPGLRRLPDTDAAVALDPGVFGDWWSLAGWTVNPDVYLVLGEGHQVGWVERDLPGLGDRWVAVYEGYFIGDQATQDAMLHDTPEQAARTVQLAYLHNL
ncbi:hypothetical protein [Kitasatospora sp. NPDC093102]|uniref:hypothetical protein n=1 Tax=Kitasatospora sp. NPDC093102 TaxID=3155069 RepID=UPI00343D87D6